MAEFNEMYSRANYYDIVFRRDVANEIDFVLEVYRRLRMGSDASSLLDLACGPGYHAREFALRGLRAIGLDLREEMLAFAAQAALAEGAEVEWIAADMRHLQLDTPVDIAISVFDGIDCLLTNDDLTAHFNAIADNLTANGLYFIDVTHPRFTTFNHYEKFQYRGERDSVRVEIDWRGDANSTLSISGSIA